MSTNYFFACLLFAFICSCSGSGMEEAAHHEIAVKVPAGTDPNELAQRYGYHNKGRIGTLDGYYLFELQDQHKRVTGAAATKAEALINANEIEWAERQIPKERHPRPHRKGFTEDN